MATPLERPTASCALHGAIYAAEAVRGVVPIVHASSGCGYQAALGASLCGWKASGPAGGVAVPSTNLSEKQVVFGGTARLREEIKNAVKVHSGALYVVLSGCPTEMIGDDIPAMAREARAQGFPVLDVASAGYRGAAADGYALFLKGVIANLSMLGEARPSDPALVNLLGIVPGQDVFWEGDLDEWTRLLAGIGLRANPVFGHAGGVDGLRDLSRAAISLVFSPAGADVARALEAEAEVPRFEVGSLPVGAVATTHLLRSLAQRLGRAGPAVDAFLEAEVRRESHFLSRLSLAYHRHNWQREFALVAGGAQAVGLTRFLTSTLGWLPKTVVVAEHLSEEAQSRIAADFKPLIDEFGAALVFSEDAGVAQDAIAQGDVEIILGRATERIAARRLGVPLVEVSNPVTDRLVLDTPLSGSRGALALCEAISRAIIGS